MDKLETLRLAIKFFDQSAKGISINNIVLHRPTIFYRSDASQFGIGGYNIISSFAWRFEIPINLRLRTSLNSLEFLACVITIWIDIIKNLITLEDCILSQTDSTSASGWLQKSNFAEANDSIIQMVTSRKLASLIIDSDSCPI
jgi:hypothetical protein